MKRERLERVVEAGKPCLSGYCMLSYVFFRLIGTATISLKDLIGDQSRSLPYKQVSLLNERGQEIGVSAFPHAK